jgi:hypothetical protein
MMFSGTAVEMTSGRHYERSHSAGLGAFLVSGGDERIAIDPDSGRNRYGLLPYPANGEVFFSSSTASAISPGGWDAAAGAWEHLSSEKADAALGAGRWFESIRSRVANHAGCKASVILSASGTDTESLALAIASAVIALPITNIVVGPGETGRGVTLAAAGRRFLSTAPFGGNHIPGIRIAGWERENVVVETVEIRRPDGAPRSADDIDADVRAKAESALAKGRGVIAHLLDFSKTGLTALTRAAAQEIRSLAPDRVLILADCCQMRSPASRLRGLLESGFMIAATGSKFYSGPPFSGALLVPDGLVARLDRLHLPKGLAAHSALYDWPAALRSKIAARFASHINIGLGLRWEAALWEMDRFRAVPEPLAVAIAQRFQWEVRRRARDAGLTILCREGGVSDWASTIMSIAARDTDGRPYSAQQASALQEGLRRPSASGAAITDEIFHVGQPVPVGPDLALRVCLSAPMISDVAQRCSGSVMLDEAIAPLAENVATLFAKWQRLIN